MQLEDFSSWCWIENLTWKSWPTSHRTQGEDIFQMKCRHFCGRFLPSHSSEIQQILHITVPLCIAYEAAKLTDTKEDSTGKDQISVYITTGHFSCLCLIQGAFQNLCRATQWIKQGSVDSVKLSFIRGYNGIYL